MINEVSWYVHFIHIYELFKVTHESMTTNVYNYRIYSCYIVTLGDFVISSTCNQRICITGVSPHDYNKIVFCAEFFSVNRFLVYTVGQHNITGMGTACAAILDLKTFILLNLCAMMFTSYFFIMAGVPFGI